MDVVITGNDCTAFTFITASICYCTVHTVHTGRLIVRTHLRSKGHAFKFAESSDARSAKTGTLTLARASRKPPKFGKYFSGNYRVKFGILLFFSYVYFRAKNVLAPTSVTVCTLTAVHWLISYSVDHNLYFTAAHFKTL